MFAIRNWVAWTARPLLWYNAYMIRNWPDHPGIDRGFLLSVKRKGTAMPKALNEEVYFVQGAYHTHGGFYAWGNTIEEALRGALKQDAEAGDQYVLLKIKGDFQVSHFDGSISHQKGGLRTITPEPRLFPKNLRREAEELERLERTLTSFIAS